MKIHPNINGIRFKVGNIIYRIKRNNENYSIIFKNNVEENIYPGYSLTEIQGYFETGIWIKI